MEITVKTETPLCDALARDALDSNDMSAWHSLAYRLEKQVAALKHDLARGMANHNADINAVPEVARSGETPRTDALVGTFYLRCDDCPQAGKCERMKSVHPDDARQLERDFNDAMSGAAKLYEKLKQAQSVPSPLARKCRHGYREENCGLCHPELEPKETPQSGA